MDILVPLLLLLSPVCVEAGLRPAKYKQYHQNNLYNNSLKTWAAAQRICRKRHSDLVTIRKEPENQYFFSGYGWIGLYRSNSPGSVWKWSRRNEIANFTIWKSGEPDSTDRCAYKIPNEKKWRGSHCKNNRPFMCYDETLVLVKEKKTWEDALEHCRSLEVQDPTAYNSHLYDLVTLLTPDDHDYAREKIQEANTDVVWTGLRFLAGQWMWVGGERLQYSIHDCPAEKLCGVLEKNGTAPFNTRHCTDKYNFLCYRRPSL